MTTIVTLGGSSKFDDYGKAEPLIDKALKDRKLKNKKVVIYGWEDSSDLSGAYMIAETYARNRGYQFYSGQPKSKFKGDWKRAKAERDEILSTKSHLFINLCVGSSNGGADFVSMLKEKVPTEVINLKDEVDKSELTPSQKRKGEIPDAEAVKRSIPIYSKQSQNLIDARCFMLDIESTGLTDNDEAIEIAIGDCYTGEIVFNSLINTDVEINPAALKIHGITKEMIKDAPTIDKVWPLIEAIVGHRPVIASHSASEVKWFDEKIINQSLRKHGLVCGFIWKDIQPLYRLYSCQLSETQYPLQTRGICLQLGIDPGEHRAKGDVVAQMKILKAMAKGVVPDFTV